VKTHGKLSHQPNVNNNRSPLAHAAHSHSRPSTATCRTAITKFSRSSTSHPPSLKRHPHQSCVSLLTHRQKASPLPVNHLANEKFGVIFTFARHLAILRGCELWPLPVRACHELLHGCTRHQKTQPASLASARESGRCYGSRCEDRVCRVRARYDHFSAIRSVFLWLYSPLFAEGSFAGGVSFDSDYSGGGDASFLLF
jgi:hypothetical protein